MTTSLAPLREEHSEKTFISCLCDLVLTARQRQEDTILAHLGLAVNICGIILQNEGKHSYIKLLNYSFKTFI